MSKKTKGISKSQFSEIANKVEFNTTDVIWEGLKLSIKHKLTAEEAVGFVKTIADICFDNKNDEYMPEVYKFALGVATIKYYVDTDDNFTELDVETLYKIITFTSLVTKITEHVEPEQYLQLQSASKERIRHKCKANVNFIYRQINDLYESASTLYQKISDTFSGFSEEDFKSVVSAISNHEIDEAKMMDIYMKHVKENVDKLKQET